MNNFKPLRFRRSRTKPFTCDLQSGFSLLELLIVIAILSVLLGIAFVGLQSSIENTQTEETMNNLRMDTVFARGEAIKRGGWVGLCGTTNGTSCAGNFDRGWLVFHDIDKDNLLGNKDTVLRWTAHKYASVIITPAELGPMSNDILTFNYRGYPDRPIQLSASRGEAFNGFIIQTSGSIEKK